jgi:hypothetical protein
LSKPNTFSRVCSIFSGVWHTQPPDTSKDIPEGNDEGRDFVPAIAKGTTLKFKRGQLDSRGVERGRQLSAV